MNFNIDIAIFIVFLTANLIIGLFSGKGIETVKDYAIGDGKFSTATIASTIVATWIAGSTLALTVSETYNNGLYFMSANLADPIAFLVIGYFLAPRMKEFLGQFSVAEALGSLYGNKVRLIVAICSICLCVGLIGLQVNVISSLISYFFKFDYFLALIITVSIVIIYSAFGGIKAVTFTDVIQFFTFGVFIPSLALVIWGTLNSTDIVTETISTSALFDYKELFDLSKLKFYGWLALFLYCGIPAIDPAIFQRISMSKNINQVRNSFFLAAFVIFCICILMYFIGILLLSKHPNVQIGDFVGYIIETYSYPGFRGLTIIGILAMAMSTADSYINSAAILAAHDVTEALNIKILEKRKLFLSRFFSVLIGIFALIPALLSKNILDSIIAISSFYMPIVSVPLLLAIFGFRSSSKSALLGMLFGALTVIYFTFTDTNINAVIPGMIANLITLMGSHYLLRQKGGWVGIKNPEPLIEARRDRRRTFRKLIERAKNFSLFEFCKKNSPKHDYVYSLFAFFCIISVFSTMYSLPIKVRDNYKDMVEMIYHIVLLSSTGFLTYPIWPPTVKRAGMPLVVIAWNIAVPFSLIIAPTLLVILSNFGQFQLMILMLNIVIIANLLRWKMAILTICFGFFIAIKFFKFYANIDELNIDIGNIQFKMTYFLLLLSSVLIGFLKPKEDEYDLSKDKINHLTEIVKTTDNQMQKVKNLKEEFLRNIEHEFNNPLTGITSMSDVLYNCYDKLNDKEVKDGIETIFLSSARLETFSNNLINLSKFLAQKVNLNLEKINLGNLLIDRIKICKKLYEATEDQEFILNIDANIMIEGDKIYLSHAFDNLILNAISYCKQGKITINLHKKDDKIEFIIEDAGIGIPEDELESIFDSFAVSSATRTPASGRGIGLSLTRMVINLHRGSIIAENNGNKGARFKVIL